jgi:hypothetical protein
MRVWGTTQRREAAAVGKRPNTADRQLLCVTRARQQQQRQWLCGRAASRLLCNVECGHIGPFLPCKSKPSTRMRRCAASYRTTKPRERKIARCNERLRGIAVLRTTSVFGSMPLERVTKLTSHPSVKRIELKP